MKLKAGDWVEVRSKEEILHTLDGRGRLEELPFMPQMFQYCGQKFKVYKRAHKTCDTVNQTGGRRLKDGVHLDIRCSGEEYGGCQAACLIFWKEAWLKSISGNNLSIAGHEDRERNMNSTAHPSLCSEADVWSGTRAKNQHMDGETRYQCQATALPLFTTLLPWWDIRQYVEDYRSGNASLDKMVRAFLYAGYYNASNAGIGLGRPMRWCYDRFQELWGGIPYPRWKGKIPTGQKTPTNTLDLQPGEWVRVKSYKEILATLDTFNKNKGLYFDAEHVPYCEGVYRVKSRVTEIIDEKTGKLISFKNVSIILEGVVCQARYSNCRLFCPRSIYPWWREIWLERISESIHGDKNRS